MKKIFIFVLVGALATILSCIAAFYYYKTIHKEEDLFETEQNRTISETTNLWFDSKLEKSIYKTELQDNVINKIVHGIDKLYSGVTLELRDSQALNSRSNVRFQNQPYTCDSDNSDNDGFVWEWRTGEQTAKVCYDKGLIINVSKVDTTNINNVAFYNKFIGSLKGKIGFNKLTSFNSYSKAVFNFFDIDSNEIKTLNNIKAGRIYIGCKDETMVIYPNHNQPFDGLKPTERKWWLAAFSEDEESKRYPSEFVDSLNKKYGLSAIYSDINEKTGSVDLVRTFWYKKSYKGKQYLICFDLFITDIYPIKSVFSSSIQRNNWFLYPLLFLGLSTIIFSLFALYKQIVPIKHNPNLRIYKLNRIVKESVGWPGNRNFSATHELSTDIKVSEISNHTFNLGWNFTASPIVISETGTITDSRAKTDNNGSKITFNKNFDLTLTRGQNLKTIELWQVTKLSNGLPMGLIEVLWLSSDENDDITVSKLFWKSSMSQAMTDDMIALLKDQLRKSEDGIIFYDSEETKKDAEVLVELKKNQTVKNFSERINSFNSRRFIFGDDTILVKDLYKEASVIEATSSINFLKYLNSKNQLIEVLSLGNSVRYIIVDNKIDFVNFFNKLEDPEKEFLRESRFFVVGNDGNINNRDFCIIEFENNPNKKCVIVTDTTNKFSGFISWRVVDIDFYSAIFKYISNATISRKSIKDLLES